VSRTIHAYTLTLVLVFTACHGAESAAPTDASHDHAITIADGADRDLTTDSGLDADLTADTGVDTAPTDATASDSTPTDTAPPTDTLPLIDAGQCDCGYPCCVEAIACNTTQECRDCALSWQINRYVAPNCWLIPAWVGYYHACLGL
jgi:hypothetical protein